MSSYSSNPYYDIDNIIAREHLQNFYQLPFNIYFTIRYSALPSHLKTFFNQIPASSVPIQTPPRQQRLILVETEYHYQYIFNRRGPPTNLSRENSLTDTSSTSDSDYHSSSSLPPFVPIPSLNIQQSPSDNLTASPNYTPPFKNTPEYQRPQNTELISRRIRILERDSIDIRNTTTVDRDLTISRIYTETDQLITDHQDHNSEEIQHCEELLYF